MQIPADASKIVRDDAADSNPSPSRTVLDRAVDALEGLVTEQLEPGMHLSSEAQLAADLGVSRITIREALKVLAGRGLVELGRGRRPMVRYPDSSVLSGHLAIAVRRDPSAVLELHQIRQSLEVLSASAAAKNAGRAALGGIETALVAMQNAAERRQVSADWVDEYNKADVAFHEALALASGNKMLGFMLEGLGDALSRNFAMSFEGFVESGRDVMDTVEGHRRIFEHVRDGESKRAAAAMTAQLSSAESDLKNAMRAATIERMNQTKNRDQKETAQ